MSIRKSCLFLLTVFSVLLLFAACGRQSVSSQTPAAPVSSAEPTPSPVPTPTPTPEPVVTVLKRSDGSELLLPEETVEVTVDDVALFAGLIENTAALPELRSIELADALAFTAEDAAALQEAYPTAVISYRVIINGNEIDPSATALDLSSLPESAVPEAARELRKLASLQQVTLNSGAALQDVSEPKEDGTDLYLSDRLHPEDIHLLESACPDAVFDCAFLLYGKRVSTADERLEYTDVKITDEGVENVFRRILPAMSKLKYLKLDKCEVTSPVMAQLRDDFPDIKIVWRVYFSSYGQTADGSYAVYNCLTDTERVWATGCVTDNFAKELQYCTDVKYLDLGHNCITNIDFVRYMPNLEVAVLSVSWVESIAPLAECENLEYLECFSSHITDISPLAACKNLRYLNISNLPSVKDISSLYGLDLVRLYCTMSYIPAAQQEEFKALHPDCDCEFGWVDPSKGYWRFLDGNYMNTDPSNRQERYALLYEQFGYDSTANQSK